MKKKPVRKRFPNQKKSQKNLSKLQMLRMKMAVKILNLKVTVRKYQARLLKLLQRLR